MMSVRVPFMRGSSVTIVWPLPAMPVSTHRPLSSWDWLGPVMGAFLKSADDEQVHRVDTLFPELDFRRFQVQMSEDIGMDQPEQMPQLLKYGEELGRKILNDEMDIPPSFKGPPLPYEGL